MKQKKNPTIVVEEISASKEIALVQLERLKALSRERLLSYEELKMYDILNKNLMLINGEPTTIVSSAKVEDVKALEETEKQELIKIATTFESKNVKDVLNIIEEPEDNDPKLQDK